MNNMNLNNRNINRISFVSGSTMQIDNKYKTPSPAKPTDNKYTADLGLHSFKEALKNIQCQHEVMIGNEEHHTMFSKHEIVLKLIVKIGDKSLIFVAGIYSDYIDFKACFDKPKDVGDILLKSIANRWNDNRKLTRMSVDDEEDIWLRAEILIPSVITASVLRDLIQKALIHFITSISNYQNHVVNQIPKLTIDTKLIIEKNSESVKFHGEKGERCVLCMEDFNQGDHCLKLKCGHIFHKSEVERYLFTTRKCPLCRAVLE